MKKITALVAALAFFASSAFAMPGAGSVLPETGENGIEIDLFSAVQATPLTTDEMECVEGEIAPVVIVVGIVIVGAAIAGLHGCNMNPISPGPNK